MPAINLDFTDDDYERVRAAAENERLSLKSFARSAVLARTVSTPATWALVTTTAEKMPALSDAAEELMTSRRGRSPDDHTYRANGCRWVHLTEVAAVIAYPTSHYTSTGGFEFVLDRGGVAEVLDSWSEESGLMWKGGDAIGQRDAWHLAIAVGNRRLGLAAQ